MAHFVVVQIGGGREDAFAESEAEREVPQVRRCGQHHGVRDAVELQRDRHFFGEPVVQLAALAVAPSHHRRLASTLERHRCEVVTLHLAATVSFAKRRSSSSACILSKRLCSRCHWDGCVTGMTCTAVTLYSGQLVAQSELSVVITLAPDSGKWNVVYTTPGATRALTLARSTV